MADSKIRLLSVAKEINIGKDAIVQLLESKGFAVENKPMTVLSEEMLEVIYDKFKREKKTAEKQREKLEKHKQIRKPGSKDSADAAGDEHSHDGPVAHDEHEEHLAHNADDHDAVQHEAHPEHVTVEHAEAHLSPREERIIIDLGKFEKYTRKDPKQKSTAEASHVVPPKPQEVHQERIETEKSEKQPEKPFDKQLHTAKVETHDKDEKIKATKPEPSKTVKTEVKPAAQSSIQQGEKLKSHDKPVEHKPAEHKPVDNKILDKPEEIPDFDDDSLYEDVEDDVPLINDPNIIVDPNLVIDPLENKEKRNKKRRRRKKIAEVQIEPGQAPKLKGLTIVGKIDLTPKPHVIIPRDVKGKKVETDATEAGSASKFKKKIVKGKVKEKVVIPKDNKTIDKKKKRKRSIRELITDEDIDRAIKETLSGMDENSVVSQRSKMRARKKVEREEKEQRRQEVRDVESHVMQLTEFVTTSDLAAILNISPTEIIMKCMGLGLMVSINQRLDKETIEVIADDYGMTVNFLDEKSIQDLDEQVDNPEDLLPRSPIVTIMGHVDHGKTSLLDYIRSANVVAGEAGGITQHIGAYRVDMPNGKHITFLDTPGHEAFTAMRARGAQVTDIVVLVVAADDSVMPQTIEAISHAQAANVPIVVAINKIDKPDAKPDRIRQQLADRNILVEDWGGKYQSVEISAKIGTNVILLLEKILLEAEMLELKANPNRKTRAAVIESNMDRGLGPVSTIIIQKGTLKIGDPFIAGNFAGRVRAMLDERGNKVETALPSMPVRLIGFEGMPEAGDILVVTDSDTEARTIASQRMKLRREQDFRAVHHITLDDISRQIQLGGVKELLLIVKGDVAGSVEALSDSLQKLSLDEVRVLILHRGVGSITESDVMLAVASNAIIIGFQVNPTSKARKLADNEAVEIRLYNIIYNCISEVKLAMEGLLTPDIKEDIIGTIEVRKVFKISKMGAIAGCYILSGRITRNDKVRLLRDGLPVFSGGISSLKRNKDDVREVEQGYECGIALDGYNELQVGDIIEVFKITEVKRTLS